MNTNSDDEAFRAEIKKLSGLPTAILLVVVLTNYGLCLAWLMSLPLTVGDRTICAFVALTFGYAVSGQFMWMMVHRLTRMPAHRCMYYGTFAGHALGALVGGFAGYYLSR